MGLRCLFGHEFEGREVERDRREDGAEVVVAYRTVETCARCGRRRVVSENKEIKPLRTGEEPTPAAGAATDESGSPPASAPASASAPDAGVEATTSGDDGADAASPPETAPPDASPAPEPTDASDDAAIILDDTTPSTDAGESATADTETTDTTDADDTPAAGEPSEAAAWPAADADDDGFDAETPTSGGPTVSTGADPAPWPDEGTVERDRNGTRFVRPEPVDGDVDGATELHCPNCATAHAAASSSLRPGDVCPDCRKGYLAERAAESPGRNA